jgi:hypothetical protein
MAGLVPAIPILKSTALHTIGITGTGPVMTGESLTLQEPKRSIARVFCWPSVLPPYLASQ